MRGLLRLKLKIGTLPCLLVFYCPKQGQWPKTGWMELSLHLVEELQDNMAKGMDSEQECSLPHCTKQSIKIHGENCPCSRWKKYKIIRLQAILLT